MEVSGQLHVLASLVLGKEPGVKTRTRVDTLVKKKSAPTEN
jgi:hypothetical protein